MTKIAKIAGIDAAFGARWDDARDGARIKTKFMDTVGWYDGKAVGKDIAVAPSLIHSMIEVKDAFSVYAIFYKDDTEKVFASIIFSAGQVYTNSEVIYDDLTEWEGAITRTTRDPNIDFVYLTEDAQSFIDDKHILYSITDEIAIGEVAHTSTGISLATAGIVAGMAITLAAIPIGAWLYIANPFEQKVEQAIYVTEKTKPNYSEILEKCGSDLSVPWPSSPEWTLVQEGCVTAPEFAQITLPKPTDGRPYSYRYYELDSSTWDEYLSRKAFQKMAERFPGNIIEGINQVVLYVPYNLKEERVDNGYTANSNPMTIVEHNFVGTMTIDTNKGVSGSKGKTDLELDLTMKRLIGERLTVPHINWNYRNNATSLVFQPEIVNSRKKRVN
jgi:hypothetical protein